MDLSLSPFYFFALFILVILGLFVKASVRFFSSSKGSPEIASGPNHIAASENRTRVLHGMSSRFLDRSVLNQTESEVGGHLDLDGLYKTEGDPFYETTPRHSRIIKKRVVLHEYQGPGTCETPYSAGKFRLFSNSVIFYNHCPGLHVKPELSASLRAIAADRAPYFHETPVPLKNHFGPSSNAENVVEFEASRVSRSGPAPATRSMDDHVKCMRTSASELKVCAYGYKFFVLLSWLARLPLCLNFVCKI